MSSFKPMKACNYDPEKLRFPLFAQPKIDGVRGLVVDNKLIGRSLKPHANKYTTEFFSQPRYNGLDGELAASSPKDSDLCRKTTSKLSTIVGSHKITFIVFDYLIPSVIKLNYESRYTALMQRVLYTDLPNVSLMPTYRVENKNELDYWHQQFLEQGYEGTILRDPKGFYKHGRATVNEGSFLRIKDFAIEEALVLDILEGSHNTNEAQTNELGYQFRTSHQQNKVPNGMIGALVCKDLKTGKEIKVSAGKMTHQDRIYYYCNDKELIGRVIKYKTLKHGVKDKPRFPTFECLRAISDIDPELYNE